MKQKIRDQRDGNWYWISRSVYLNYAERIGVIGLAVYNAYASYAFQNQEVYPSQNTIAKKLGITKPTLIKYSKILAKYKLIRIEKKDGKSNHVFLLDILDLPVKEVNRGGKGRLLPGVKDVYPNKNKLKKNKKNKIVRKRISDHPLLKDKTPKKDFYTKSTDKLIKLLLAKKIITRIPNKKKWAKQIELLNKKDGAKKKEINRVLNWYKIHVGEFRVPEGNCAESFRLKFDRIRAAIVREDNKPKEEKKTVYRVHRK